MGPSRRFFSRRAAVSELYASLLMVGVTLSLGGAVTAAAMSQYGMQTSSASVSGSVEQASVGKLVSLVYAQVSPGSGGCTRTYYGATEGDTLTLDLFDYGPSAFTPSVIVINSTLFASDYPALLPGGMTAYALTLPECAHASGQTILLEDSRGDEVEIGT